MSLHKTGGGQEVFFSPRISPRGTGADRPSHGLHQRVDIAIRAAHIHSVPGYDGGGKDSPDRQHLLDARNHVVIEKIEESGFVVWYAVRFCISRAVLLGILGFKDPCDFLRFQVDSVESALMRADVESIAGNGG